MANRIALEQLTIAEPCHASWEAMTGDAQKRFCDSCAKHVHDLSTMSREEAEAIVNSGASVCIRMQREPGGMVKTKTRDTFRAIEHRAAGTKRSRIPQWLEGFPPKWMRAAAGIATMLGITSLFQSGCKPTDNTVQGGIGPESPHVRTMGIVAMPERVHQPEIEMGDVAPATRPSVPGEIVPLMGTPLPIMGKPARGAITVPEPEPMIMGEIVLPAANPTANPSTRPSTQPAEELIKMGKVAPATQPTALPGATTFWKTSPYDTDGGFLLPTDD